MGLTSSTPLCVVYSVQAGAIGEVLSAVFLDDNGDPVDISGASEISVYVVRPDLTVAVLEGAYITDGIDGAVQAVTSADTLPTQGRYAVLGYVVATTADFTGFSDRYEYDVGRSPEVVP